MFRVLLLKFVILLYYLIDHVGLKIIPSIGVINCLSFIRWPLQEKV